MTIAGIEPVSVSGTKLNGSDTEILGKDDFLNLLVAQLQHQDPLNPLESNEFTAQLAQFTSLEQLNNVNQNLVYLQQYQASIKDSQAVSFIGKTVEAFGNSVPIQNGNPGEIHFDLTGDAEVLQVNLYDPTGGFVRTIDKGALSNGRHSLPWDGKDQQGNQLHDGRYTFEIMAVDAGSHPVAAIPYVSSRVTGVSFGSEATYVLAGDSEIPVSDIRKVSGD